MATKTISVSLEAYEKLAAARISERESFSRVICRATWPPRNGTAADLLETAKRSNGRADVESLDQAQVNDHPAADPWDDTEADDPA